MIPAMVPLVVSEPTPETSEDEHPKRMRSAEQQNIEKNRKWVK
jgi:hypothetical protein